MRLGLHALGVGPGAKRAVIEAAAAAAEQRGFATLWAGEHVVMVDEPASRYPYSVDGTIAVPATADWIDPLIALIFAALGVGIGWSREEFDALGVPFERRAARTAEYVTAMRRLWCDDIASFAGEFVSFGQVRLNPKPVHDRRIPIILGGNSDAALRRVARWGDGWYGFNLPDVAAVANRVAAIRRLCGESGRDAGELRLAVSLAHPGVDDVEALSELGIDELIIVAGPPDDIAAIPDWLARLTPQPAVGL